MHLDITIHDCTAATSPMCVISFALSTMAYVSEHPKVYKLCFRNHHTACHHTACHHGHHLVEGILGPWLSPREAPDMTYPFMSILLSLCNCIAKDVHSEWQKTIPWYFPYPLTWVWKGWFRIISIIYNPHKRPLGVWHIPLIASCHPSKWWQMACLLGFSFSPSLGEDHETADWTWSARWRTAGPCSCLTLTSVGDMLSSYIWKGAMTIRTHVGCFSLVCPTNVSKLARA